MAKAICVFREKVTLRNGLTRVGIIWRVGVSEKYPDGIRYRLALVDIVKKELLILFDNHFPKGHHCHMVGEKEKSYSFESIEKLVCDYKSEIEIKERRHADQKNWDQIKS